MEIIDKRKIDGEGNAVSIEEHPEIEKIIHRVISELPCVYDDHSPMTNHCLVKQNAAETYYKGTRFAIPESAQQSPNEGVVVAVGPDIDPISLMPGDLVTFGRYNAEPIEVDGDLFQLVSFHDIKLRRKVTYAVASN